MNLNKVIIWGHELHNHTHSYIHNAFYLAFKHMGYDIYWFNEEGQNNYTINNLEVDFNNALYIVHGLESKNLPLNDSSYYIGHNVEWTGSDFKIPKNHVSLNSENENQNEIKGIPSSNINTLQVYCIGCVDYKSYKNIHYYKYADDYSCMYMPWATDIFPKQIDQNIKDLIILDNGETKKISNFIGMPLDQWDEFKSMCAKHGIEYRNYGGTFNKDSDKNRSVQENMELIQESIIAPALQSEWQIENKYIPCRIFKNISYGKMGITNSKAVNELFDNKLIYSTNIEELVKQGLEFEKNKERFDKIKELMIEVRDNHTYINRINFILDFIKEFKNIHVSKTEMIEN